MRARPHVARRGLRAAAITLVLAVLTAPAAAHRPRTLFSDSFDHPNGPNDLVTNEFACGEVDGVCTPDPDAVQSPDWEMSSGSLFSRDGMGTTGAPDAVPADRYSEAGTDSATFRLRTKRTDFGNVRVDVDVRVNRWTPEARPDYANPSGDVVLWVRYSSEFSLYWPSMLRDDGQVDVEKKVPSPPEDPACPEVDNGGTYYILPPYTQDGWPVELGRWYHLTVKARTRWDGSVVVKTYRDGELMQRAVDAGSGQTVQCAADGSEVSNPTDPITADGRVGIRGDNADFDMRDFRVRSLRHR